MPEALLARHERITVVEVFHLALLQIVGEADIVVRREQQAGAFALEPLADGRDFLGRGFLLGKQMVESEHHQRVGVGQNPLVDRQLETRLVNALEDGDRMAGGLAGNLLKAERGAVEKLQRAGDPLEKLRRAPLRRLVVRPEHVADFGHRREAVFHRRRIALGFPRVAPRPVDAQAAFARRVFAGNMVLVVGACWLAVCSWSFPLAS